MARLVTLKSPSDEDIYPVTDASGIRVTGNVTLQQALDGFVYAEDPTAAATASPWVTSSDIDWTTLNVVIDDNPSRTTFFGGTYSKQFTVPTAGYYEISTPFSCVCYRASNVRNYLELTIDGTVEFVYGYYSVTGDMDWGTTRRTITSSNFVVYLTAGTHTIGTQGNLYYDHVSSTNYTALKAFYAKYFAPSN